MLKMVDGTGIIGVDMICPLGVSTPQPPNYDRVELEGTGMLVLPNSLDAPLERLELGGKTEQVSTTGVNVWNPKSYIDFGLNENSADSIKYENNIVTYISDNGTYNQITVRIPIGKLRAGQYKISFGKVYCKRKDTGGTEIAMIGGFSVLKNDALIIRSSTFTVDDPNADYIISFSGYCSEFQGLLELSIENPMIATTDINKFEPYTGGKPSPSPEYPQEIKNSGKWNEEKQKYEVDVKVTGKNLLNLQKEPDVKGTYQGWKVGNGELLTLGVKDKGNNADIKGCYIGFSDQGSESNGVVWVVDNGVIKANPLNQRKAYVSIFPANETTVKKLTERLDIQCELGNVTTPYQPYKEQTLTLTSDRPITKWDRLVEQDGQIGWLYNSVNETIDGKTGKWSIQPASKIFYRTDIAFPIAVPFCSELLGYDYSSVGYKKDTGITINILGILCITLPEEVELTLDAYKQYLADNPLHVLYKDDSEEFVPLPQSEQNAIRALKTYYPTTVITADGGELDPDIKVTYRKEI